jgi:hypothetical protein
MALGSAETTADPAAPRHQDAVAEVPELLTLGLQYIPEVPGLRDVRTKPS